MNKLNNYFTINQTLILQNFTWGGVENTYNIPLNKEFCKNVNKKYNMINFTVNCNF